MSVLFFTPIFTASIYDAVHTVITFPTASWESYKGQNLDRQATQAFAEQVLSRGAAPRLPLDPRGADSSIYHLAPTFPKVTAVFSRRLPYDVRHRILLFAFGGRTLHMSLINDVGGGSGGDEHSIQRWRLSGCVCHRSHCLLW